MSALDLELEFLNKKDEYIREFAIESLANLIYQTEDSKVHLQSEEFKSFFAKVEAIKDMLVNL